MQNTVVEDAKKMTFLHTELLLCQKSTSQNVSNIVCFAKFHILFRWLRIQYLCTHSLRNIMQIHTKHSDRNCQNQRTGLKTVVESKYTLQSESN